MIKPHALALGVYGLGMVAGLAVPSECPPLAACRGVEPQVSHLDTTEPDHELRPLIAASVTSTYTRLWLRGTAQVLGGRSWAQLSTLSTAA